MKRTKRVPARIAAVFLSLLILWSGVPKVYASPDDPPEAATSSPESTAPEALAEDFPSASAADDKSEAASEEQTETAPDEGTETVSDKGAEAAVKEGAETAPNAGIDPAPTDKTEAVHKEETKEESNDGVEAASDDENDAPTEEPTESEVPLFSKSSEDAILSESQLFAIDFSTKRLLLAIDPALIVDPEHILSSYEGVHLLQYEDAETARNAYSYYYGKAAFVEPDTVIAAADGNADQHAVGTDPMSEAANPFSELQEAVESSSAAAGNVIALIDTGVNDDPSVIEWVSMIGDRATDDNGHGSNMAALIRQQNPDAKILSIKALGADGTGDVSAVYAAMKYAIERGVSIIALPMAAPKKAEHAAIAEVIREASGKGIKVVGAAGNYGANASYFIPGGIDEAIIIGACDAAGRRLTSSSYGTSVDFNVAAESTSRAAAIYTGLLSAGKGEIDQALVFPADFEPYEFSVEDLKEDGSFVIDDYAVLSAGLNPSYASISQMPQVRGFMHTSETGVMADYWFDFDGNGVVELDDVHQNTNALGKLIQAPGILTLYDVSEESPYYVAVLKNHNPGAVVQFLAANNNNNGERVSGAIFDRNTGIIYFPKSAFTNFSGLIASVQAQFVYLLTAITTEHGVTQGIVSGDFAAQDASVMNANLKSVIERSAQFTLNFGSNELPKAGDRITSITTASIWQSSGGTDPITYGPDWGVPITAESQAIWEKLVRDLGGTTAYNFTPDPPSQELAAQVEIALMGMQYGLQSQDSALYNKYAAQLKNLLARADVYGNLKTTAAEHNVIYYMGQTSNTFTFLNKLDGRSTSAAVVDNPVNDFGKVLIPVSCTHIGIALKQGMVDATEMSGKHAQNDDIQFGAIVLDVDSPNGNGEGYIYAAIQSFMNLADSGGGKSQDMFGLFKIPYRLEQNGSLTLTKSSANTAITEGNACYDLTGAQYTVYTDRACTAVAKDVNGNSAVLTVKDNSGVTNTLELKAGTYYIRETKAGKGYALDAAIYTKTVESGKTAVVEVKDIPNSDPIGILLRKADAGSGTEGGRVDL